MDELRGNILKCTVRVFQALQTLLLNPTNYAVYLQHSFWSDFSHSSGCCSVYTEVMVEKSENYFLSL